MLLKFHLTVFLKVIFWIFPAISQFFFVEVLVVFYN